MDTEASPARVQHVTKASSDELLRKFAEVGSESEDKAAAKKELQLAKRRRKAAARERDLEQCESPSSRRASWVERKSLLSPAAASRRSSALVRNLGIGRSRLRARELRNKSFVGTIQKTWRRTIEGALKVFLEKHHNRHKRLINDVV
ncbi:uncharacterized protein LOC127788977 [Diospyros lotus]|uniref:uncharacterized protein LOC127788977 n=1 Tax=Diospyros lotus TaxID=55363 RepID=UPI00224FD7DB|nr:uncharacterized protein LOC127788977 [Diospyros lotus]